VLLCSDSILPPGCFVAWCLCFSLHFFNPPASETGSPLYNLAELSKPGAHACLAPASGQGSGLGWFCPETPVLAASFPETAQGLSLPSGKQIVGNSPLFPSHLTKA